MPEKFDRCVDKVNEKGGVDSAYAICNSSMNKTKEGINQNRLDPYPSPDIKTSKVEPQINHTTKDIGGGKIGNMTSQKRKQEAILFKQILDSKLGYFNGPQRKK